MFPLDAEGDSSLDPVLPFSMTSSLKTNHFLLVLGIQVSRSHSQVPNPRDLQNCTGSMGMAKETGAKISFPLLPEALGLPVKFWLSRLYIQSSKDFQPNFSPPISVPAAAEAEKEMIHRTK